MKKFILILLTVLFSGIGAMAQMTTGHVSYKIDVASEDPESAMAVAMFANSTMDLYFDEDISRVDLDMGGLMSIATVSNAESGEVLILLGGMMGNMGVITSLEEMGTDEDDSDENITVTLLKETKTIAGYKCKKALLLDDEGNEITYWYTDKIKANTKGQDNFNSKIPGFPLEYSVNNEGMLMTFSASVVDKSLENEEQLFAIEIPEGYEKMTYEEFSSFGM